MSNGSLPGLEGEDLRVSRDEMETSLAFYADLYDCAPAGYFTLDGAGVILRANLAAAASLGEERARLQGQRLGSWIHQESSAAWSDLLKAMQQGAAHWTGLLAFVQAGGAPRYQQAAANRSGLGADEPRRYRLLLLDITEQRQREEHERQAHELDALRVFAGGLARDFANVLTVVLTSSGLASDDLTPNDPLRVELEAIRAAAERSRSLVRQLLAFSCNEELEPRVMVLNEVVRGLERSLSRIFEDERSRSISLAANLGQIEADPAKIEQAILFIARHARDDMRSTTLSIETSNVEIDRERAKRLSIPAGGYVLLTVTDSGRGMDERTRARAFTPFFFNGTGAGTGLGLSVVYGIVKQSGGWIRIRSQPGRGSTFELYWPRVASGAAARQTSDRTGETILVVEDNEPVRRTAVRILESLGYRVLSAGGLDEAISQLDRFGAPVDLLLTDVVMPKANGPEVSRVASERMPGIRTLYMSGYAHDTFAPPGVLAPGTPLVQKPFTREVLAKKVREALDR